MNDNGQQAAAALAESEASRASLFRELKNADGRIDELSGELRSVRFDLEKVTKERDKLRIQLDDLGKLVKVADHGMVASFQGEIDRLTGELRSARDRCEDYRLEASRLTREWDNAIRARNEAKKENTKLRAELEKLRFNLKTARGEAEANLIAFERERKDVEKLEADFLKASQERNQARREKDHFVAVNRGLSEAHEKLKKEYRSAKESIGRVAKDVQTLSTERNFERKQAFAAEERQKSALEDVAKWRTAAEEWRKQADALKRKLDDHREDCGDCVDAHEEMSKEIKLLKQALALETARSRVVLDCLFEDVFGADTDEGGSNESSNGS